MYESAVSFADGAEQFDDITMLLFESVQSVILPISQPTYDDIPPVTEKINALVKGLNKDKISELDVILDEMINNYVSYAFADVKKPQLDIEARLFNGVVTLTFTDNGALFDPLQSEPANVDVDVKDRPYGGVGLTIVKSLSDKISYCVFEGKNRLAISKDLKG